MNANMDCTAVILAGGKSQRMGKDKALLKLKGISMLETIVSQLNPHFENVAIVSSNPQHQVKGAQRWPDVYPGKGPLGGLYTALMHAPTLGIVAFSCDNPVLSEKVITYLIKESEKADVVLTSENDDIVPFPGFYSKNCTKGIKKRIDCNNLSVKDAVKEFSIRIKRLDEIDSNYHILNMNTPEDFLAHAGN